MNITIEYLRLRFKYEPVSGKLFWKEADECEFKLHRTFLAWNNRFANMEAGSKLNNGYRYVNIKKKVMLVHRIIFAMVHGYWPTQVDHINHVRDDNRIHNLREVTVRGNAMNISLPSDNTSGRIGVYWFRQRRCWYARIMVNGKNKHLGYFSNMSDAVIARQDAELLYGFHKNHGAPANDNTLIDESACPPYHT